MMRRTIVLCALSLLLVAFASADDDECRQCEVKEQCCDCDRNTCDRQNNRNCDLPNSNRISTCNNVNCIDECDDDRRRHGDNNLGLGLDLVLSERRSDRNGQGDRPMPCCPPPPLQSSCLKPQGSDEQCGGDDAGECKTRGNSAFVFCECKEGFLPPACTNNTAFRRVNEERSERFEDLKGKVKDYFEKRKEKCDDDMPVLCPEEDEVPSAFRGTCQERVLDCFGDNATLFNIIRDSRERGCSDNQQLCAVDGCIANNIPCTVVSHPCPANKPFRCADWKCKQRELQCDNGNSDRCPAGKKSCADASTCADDEEECASMGIQWEGCGAGLVECAGKKGLCAANVTECEEFGGCPEGKTFCGIRRDGQGRAVMQGNTGLPQPICKDTCDNVRPVATPVFGELRGRAFGKLVSLSNQGTVAVVLETTRLDAFKRADNLSEGVNFTIVPVADSLVQHGAFRNFFRSGALMSAPILIEPSAEVVIEGGFLLEIPILDDSIVNESMCLKVLEKLSVVTVEDVTKTDASLELVSQCQRGSLSNCSCAVNLSHFSAYAVADDDANTQVAEASVRRSDGDASTTAAPTTTAAATSADTTAAAGGGSGATTAASGGSDATTAASEGTTAADATTAASGGGGSDATTVASGGSAATTVASGGGGSDATTAAGQEPVVTTPTPDAGTTFGLKVTTALAGVTEAQLRANLGGFRSAVAKVHTGKTADDVVVDTASIKAVTTARRKLLADGVSVDYEVKGFVSAAAATAAAAVQESASEDLVANLKAESSDFSGLTGITSTTQVVDASGEVVAVPEDGAAAGVWASWTCTVLAAAAALAVPRW
eukprot:CAMPEP_0177705292 /NCGR_PEP_ID=MMETSP0484_2-20121128/8630_1 /TAXON_ID=354590 /ORGANISM="Rhodomonas lens, Strain RHODO" /LENGTH=829 /DNA_ID=CAMNT_0019216709 /DNA_START=108 /DNA_END=2597 /DNA_ORIENTATION=+